MWNFGYFFHIQRKYSCKWMSLKNKNWQYSYKAKAGKSYRNLSEEDVKVVCSSSNTRLNSKDIFGLEPATVVLIVVMSGESIKIKGNRSKEICTKKIFFIKDFPQLSADGRDREKANHFDVVTKIILVTHL